MANINSITLHPPTPSPNTSSFGKSCNSCLHYGNWPKDSFNNVLSHSQGASSSNIYVALVKHSFWYLDLACCNHIAPDSTSCTIQTDTFHMPINHVASGSTMTIIGIVSTTQLSISNVCLMPKFSLNFLYVGQLCELGLHIRFSSIGYVV